jgi:hypothetical protein
MRRPSVARISHYSIAFAVHHIRLHIPLRHIQHQFHLSRRNRPHRAKRIDPCSKRHLALIDITQSRQHPLIQQHHRNLRVWVLPPIRSHPRYTAFNRKTLRQNIRPQLRHLAASLQRSRRMKLRHRNIESDSLPIGRPNHHPHSRTPHLPAFAGAIQMPAPAHQHVRYQNQIAG